MAISTPPAVGDYLGALRRRYIYLVDDPAGACFSSASSPHSPFSPQYQATATIMLEPSSVPKDIIETTVISYADQQIEIVQGRVMTLDSLLRIVHEIDPYPSARTGARPRRRSGFSTTPRSSAWIR